MELRTRVTIVAVCAVAAIAILAGAAVKALQSPPPIVISGPGSEPTAPTMPADPNSPASATALSVQSTPAADNSSGLQATSTAATPPGAIDASAGAATIYVHVAGAVKKPGLYTLPPDTRVFQAIKTAGGAKSTADLDAVNLAEKLSDGEKVYVPTHDQVMDGSALDAGAGNDIGEHSVLPADTAVAAVAPARSGKRPTGRGGNRSDKLTNPSQGTVDINSASAGELQRLPGVGPAMAARIVAFRQSAGGFRKPEDLMEVSGIGPKKYAKMRPFVRTN